MDHPTTEPNNASTDVKRERLKRDLESLDVVESTRDDAAARNGVVFTTKWRDLPFHGDLPNDVLTVLSDHNCMIPEQQPEKSGVWSALIHTDE